MKDDPKASTWKLARAMWVDCKMEKRGIGIQLQHNIPYKFLNTESNYIYKATIPTKQNYTEIDTVSIRVNNCFLAEL